MLRFINWTLVIYRPRSVCNCQKKKKTIAICPNELWTWNTYWILFCWKIFLRNKRSLTRKWITFWLIATEEKKKNKLCITFRKLFNFECFVNEVQKMRIIIKIQTTNGIISYKKNQHLDSCQSDQKIISLSKLHLSGDMDILNLMKSTHFHVILFSVPRFASKRISSCWNAWSVIQVTKSLASLNLSTFRKFTDNLM